jgi:hypothetical protein
LGEARGLCAPASRRVCLFVDEPMIPRRTAPEQRVSCPYSPEECVEGLFSELRPVESLGPHRQVGPKDRYPGAALCLRCCAYDACVPCAY